MKLLKTVPAIVMLAGGMFASLNAAADDSVFTVMDDPASAKKPLEGANKQVISSQADSLIKISRIWADFFPANTSNQPI